MEKIADGTEKGLDLYRISLQAWYNSDLISSFLGC